MPTTACASSARSIVDIEEATLVLQNAAGEALAAKFVDVHPSRQDMPTGVVILCHGFASSKDSKLLVQIAVGLAARGISSMRFDFSGNGESEGNFQYGNYLKEVEDLKAVVTYVRDAMQRKVLAIVGHSKGANVVLLYGGAYDDVPYIVNISGRYDMKVGVRERFGEQVLQQLELAGQVQQQTRNSAGAFIKYMLTRKDLEERLALDMKESAKRITTGKVLTVHGTLDTVIPVKDAFLFDDCIEQHELCLVEGADHVFRDPAHAAECVTAVVEGIAQASGL